MRSTIKIVPMGAVRVTQGSRWSPRAQRYEAYKQDIRLQMRPDYSLTPELSLAFQIPMPKSWSKKKRAAMAGQPHQSRPDVDNLVKGFMDAFGVEDSHVWHVDATKRWSDSGSITVSSMNTGMKGDILVFTEPVPQIIYVPVPRQSS